MSVSISDATSATMTDGYSRFFSVTPSQYRDIKLIGQQPLPWNALQFFLQPEFAVANLFESLLTIYHFHTEDGSIGAFWNIVTYMQQTVRSLSRKGILNSAMSNSNLTKCLLTRFIFDRIDLDFSEILATCFAIALFLACLLTLKMEEICSSETSINFHQTTLCYFPEYETNPLQKILKPVQ